MLVALKKRALLQLRYSYLNLCISMRQYLIVVPVGYIIQGIITTNVQLNDKKKSDGRGKRFQITLMNMGVDKTYDSSFIKAKNRWEKVILNDLPDIPAQSGTGHDWFDGVFGKDNAVNIPIDDVLIGYRVTEIDGIPTNSNNILGQAMPIYVRLSSTLSAPTISGIMIFDKADFDSLQKVDVELIIAHEMVRNNNYNVFGHDLSHNQLILKI
jgi:hypothetical protein